MPHGQKHVFSEALIACPCVFLGVFLGRGCVRALASGCECARASCELTCCLLLLLLLLDRLLRRSGVLHAAAMLISLPARVRS